MKRGFYLIMAAQFFSSLADNALFIAAVALIQQLHGPAWMTPMIKWSFALSYVLLAAFVGAFADSYPKGRVMFATNAIKVAGCGLMFVYGSLGLPAEHEVYLVCAAYALVGIGAAAYSPAKYGIITELLPPEQLVKGNGWIEGLTVVSIILGVVVGGALISPAVSSWLLNLNLIPGMNAGTPPAEAAIVVIALVYLIATIFNLMIPDTGVVYPPQQKNPARLVVTFFGFVRTLWHDKLGQISLAVTTLFWGAGATLQLIVIEWGRTQLGLPLNQASILMGVASVGTIVGAFVAGRFVPLHAALKVLPFGVLMGLVVMLMPVAYERWFVYTLLIVIGGLGGFFVVPMNALLQHRGHVLLSAGHSIAVQNFNEQLNILLMVASYSLLLALHVSVNTIIVIFGLLVAGLMVAIMGWNRSNHRRFPNLDELIGSHAHGIALSAEEKAHKH
jgi:MFS family permease